MLVFSGTAHGSAPPRAGFVPGPPKHLTNMGTANTHSSPMSQGFRTINFMGEKHSEKRSGMSKVTQLVRAGVGCKPRSVSFSINALFTVLFSCAPCTKQARGTFSTISGEWTTTTVSRRKTSAYNGGLLNSTSRSCGFRETLSQWEL